MKKFSEYQHLKGELLTERDKEEIGSKYWNKGKWDNFVVPFLRGDFAEQTFIDIGCNAGLFLDLAKNKGFERVIGIEPDKETYQRAIAFKTQHNKNYQVINSKIEGYIDQLLVSDVIVMANTHYYIRIEDWQNIVDKLKEKTCYVIIVTAEKKPNIKYAPSDIRGIKKSFKDWELEVVKSIEPDNTLHARRLTTLMFKSPILKRVPINILDNGNAQQRDFLKQLDKGIDWLKTDYYKRLKDYRKRTGSKQQVWSDEELIEYIHERIRLYKDVKKNGLKEPIIVNKKNNRIVDGNHRHEIMKHLDYKTIIVKYA